MNKTICSLDWTNEGTDCAYAFINQFHNDGIITGDVADHLVENEQYLFMDREANTRHLMAIKNIFCLLHKRGYIKQYFLKPTCYLDVWNSRMECDDKTVLFKHLIINIKKMNCYVSD